jgi:hypothetical protein
VTVQGPAHAGLSTQTEHASTSPILLLFFPGCGRPLALMLTQRRRIRRLWKPKKIGPEVGQLENAPKGERRPLE